MNSKIITWLITIIVVLIFSYWLFFANIFIITSAERLKITLETKFYSFIFGKIIIGIILSLIATLAIFIIHSLIRLFTKTKIFNAKSYLYFFTYFLTVSAISLVYFFYEIFNLN